MVILLFALVMLIYYRFVGYVTEVTYEQIEARLHVQALTIRRSNLRGQLRALTPLLARPKRPRPLLLGPGPSPRETRHPLQLLPP